MARLRAGARAHRTPPTSADTAIFPRSIAFLALVLLLLQHPLPCSCANTLGRVQQLEVELRKELQTQLKDKLQVAINASSFHPTSDITEEQGVVLKTSLIAAPRTGWHLLDESEKLPEPVTISEASPLCVVTPLPKRSKLDEASAVNEDEIGAHHVVASRLIHAGRMIRMARDFANSKLKLKGPSHRRRPHDPDLRPAYVRIVVPDEIADVACKVVEDEFWEWTLRATCARFSSMAEARLSSPKKLCSFAMWGVSANQGIHGRSSAGSIFAFQAGIELNLDKGDSDPPSAFPPSWIPNKYEGFTDPATGEVDPKALKKRKKGSKGPYTIVTAFSKNHYTVGLRLMNSLLMHGPKSKIKFSLVIYTMETFASDAAEQVLCMAEQIKKAGIPIVVRAFEFGHYPHWMYVRHYKAGWWAWKGVMVWETYVQRRGAVLWLDAGDFISSPEAIPGTFKALEKKAFVGITREWFGMNYRWTHPGTITFLGIDVSSTTTQCCGCLWGITPKTYETMLRPFFECSLTLQCIAPEGSSMGNHRQDQSVMSVLAWYNGYECSGPHEDILWKCDGGRNHCSEAAKGGAAEICHLK